MKDDVVVAIDTKSFPVKCPALDTLRSILSVSFVDIKCDSPLVIPCTRNMFVRDHLINNGVDLILTV